MQCTGRDSIFAHPTQPPCFYHLHLYAAAYHRPLTLAAIGAKVAVVADARLDAVDVPVGRVVRDSEDVGEVAEEFADAVAGAAVGAQAWACEKDGRTCGVADWRECVCSARGESGPFSRCPRRTHCDHTRGP